MVTMPGGLRTVSRQPANRAAIAPHQCPSLRRWVAPIKKDSSDIHVRHHRHL